jgi:DNA-binding MarR family transcriptional regulator
VTAYEAQILTCLGYAFGTLTKDISAHVKMSAGLSRAGNSALVLGTMKSLERRGYVKRMDDKTPICWMLKEQDK